MSGLLYAALAGVGFGLFQTFNRRAVLGLDVYMSTFLQLIISTAVLLAIVAATGGLSALLGAPAPAVINFALSGAAHYFAGWTLLNAAQKRIGAARTSPLVSTVPLFATGTAALALSEIPDPLGTIGMLIVVAGVYLIGSEHPGTSASIARDGRGILCALGAALCWAISPIFVRRGLIDLPFPLLGLTIGLIASSLAYGAGMLVGGRFNAGPVRLDALVFKVIAGALVAFSQWARWIALALAPIGVVLSITQLSVPVAILLTPLFVGRDIERVTSRVWLGAAIVVAGSLLLILIR
jgi:drug/metabolite transporter (DMT)-like permease